MQINIWLAAWITALIFIANLTSPILNYMETKNSNATIGYVECLKQDIKGNDKCYERFLK